MINPDGIPQIDGDLDAVATAGSTLQRTGRDIAATGADVDATWRGLSAFYEAPESGQLVAATRPIQTTADAVGSDVAAVGAALSTYADEVRPIKVELESLRSRAVAFVSSIEGDDDWNEDGGKVDEHNGLLAAVNAAVAAWMDAQRRCANTINALYGGIQYVANNGDGTVQANEFGYSKELLDGATAGDEGVPWGKPEEEDKPWYEDAFNAVVSFGEGLVVDGLWGTITGLGNLVGLGGWDAFKASWTGLGTLALSLSPGYRLIEATIGTPGPSNAELNQALVDTGKALIAYDTWDDDPARAAGAATFNIVSAVVGTKGAGGAVRGGAAASLAARVPRVAEVAARISAAMPDVRLPWRHIDMPESVNIRRLDLDTPSARSPEGAGLTVPRGSAAVDDLSARLDDLAPSPVERHAVTEQSTGGGSPDLLDSPGTGRTDDAPPVNARTDVEVLPKAENPESFHAGDTRLGAAELPAEGRLGEILAGYDRTAGMPADDFLATYQRDGRWLYPPDDGFVPGEQTVMTLQPGEVADRFGPPSGRFLSPDGTPYAQRALPPESLDPRELNLGYHRYEIVKPFDAEIGYIAPAFGQPGGGLQILLDASRFPDVPPGTRVNVDWLLQNGYIRSLDPAGTR